MILHLCTLISFLNPTPVTEVLNSAVHKSKSSKTTTMLCPFFNDVSLLIASSELKVPTISVSTFSTKKGKP